MPRGLHLLTRCNALYIYCALAAMTLAAGVALPAQADGPIAELISARQVQIGHGRELYLDCGGQQRSGRPTVILVSGYHDSSDPWTQRDVLSLLPQAVAPAVLPGLAHYGLVCTYDRPGTLRYVTGLPLTERSTPVSQPRTALDLVRELHELLASGEVPAPYVLVGHSLGGLVVQLYARTYPRQVRGIVFVDAFSPTLRHTLGALWPLYRDKVLNPRLQDEAIPSLGDQAAERVDLDASIDQVERARTLPPMPLIVLTKTEPFNIAPGSLPAGLTLDQIDEAYTLAQNDLVTLAPTTPHIFATGSEHYIQLSQPDLVINAVQLVVIRATTQDK